MRAGGRGPAVGAERPFASSLGLNSTQLITNIGLHWILKQAFNPHHTGELLCLLVLKSRSPAADHVTADDRVPLKVGFLGQQNPPWRAPTLLVVSSVPQTIGPTLLSREVACHRTGHPTASSQLARNERQ